LFLETTVKNDSEEVLVERLRARDQKAIALLYKNYSAALYGVILRIVKVEEVAEDVLQESFVKIWSSFDSYDAQKGRLFTWMLNISRNLAIDKIRSKQYRVSSKTDPMEDATTGGMVSSDGIRPDHIGIKEITEKLIPDQKVIIDLMYFGGYTQTEVAETLNIPLGTVKTRARMAIKTLAKLIK
jgi:RNA polymerase sigma factor (sigma-70 family)